MFGSAEIGRVIGKAQAGPLRDQLRQALIEAQLELKESDFSVLVVFGGVDGAGKGEAIHALNEWMDPRGILTLAFDDEPPATVAEHPPYWRYWRYLPAHGQTAFVLKGWHHMPFLDAVYERIGSSTFDRQIDRMNAFEKLLVDDGTLILKFWLHLGREQQEARFHALEQDPLNSWRVTDLDWRHLRMYDRFIDVGSHLIDRTSTHEASWTIVEGSDANYRNLMVGSILLQALKARLDGRSFEIQRDACAHAAPEWLDGGAG